MKRTALLFLTAIYLLSLVGIGVNRFYCCGKLASVTLTYAVADDGGNPSAKKDNCCKHEIKNFKVKDSHFNTLSVSFNHPAPSIVPAFVYAEHENVALILSAKIAYESHAPPDKPAVPIYTINCAYRI